ncbi:MAG: hypothetical protein KGH63_04755, partial [Candidatus Micrarchaeota archaeon]|nr:hypothetical protein [Candidatus Micrarchaeota archaeon]
MNKLLGLSLILLVLAASLFADLSPICDQCHQSFLRLSVCSSGDPGCTAPPAAGGANPLLITVNATYFHETAVSSSPAPPSASPGAQAVNPGVGNVLLFVQPAANASIRITFDGQPLVDASGRVLSACDGTQPQPPRPDPANQTPTALSDWPRCGLLTATFVSSNADAKIKPTSSSLVYCPSNLKSLGLFNFFQSLLSNPSTIRTCLPLFIVLGLLLAAMYYQGRNPLSLFDITTPRLPSVKKIKMKGASQPYQLAYKARLSNRIIGRSERAISAQIARLYKSAGATPGAIAAARASAMALLPRKSDITKGPIPHANAKAMDDTYAKYQKLISQSGASKADRDRAMEAIRRMVQVRETLA